MRGLYRSQPDGSYVIRTVAPIAYTIPMDGTVGELMNRTNISHMRPAHIHFAITAPGYHGCVTHLFQKGDEFIETDVVYGVKEPLIVEFVKKPAGQGADRRDGRPRRSTRCATTSCWSARRRRSPRRSRCSNVERHLEHGQTIARHARACPGHPRLSYAERKDVDGRDKSGHDATDERALMQRTKPPFRADHVGSLLRPAALKEARAKRERGEIGADDLKAIEDREIEKVITKQEEVGLKSITDGEFRRAFWNYDFLGAARRRRGLSRRAQDQVPGPAAQADDAARRRQARRLQPASDDRAFQVRRRRTPRRRRR